MEQKTLSPLLQKLRDTYRRKYSETMYHLRKQIYTETLEQMQAQPRILSLSCAFRRYLTEKPPILSPDDILAGHGQFVDWTHSNPDALFEEIDRLEERHDLSERQRFVLRQTRVGMKIGLYSRYPGGHLIMNYQRLLCTGYDEMIHTVRQYLDSSLPENRPFYQASLNSLLGAQENIQHYADKADILLKACRNDEAAKRLLRIRESCRHIARYPARNFFDAVQLLWLAHEATVAEQICGSLSFGRVDQFLLPYYRMDVDQGNITETEAGEILQAFWLKCAGLPLGYQSLTLGGTDIDGTDQSNELTRLCLQATRLVQVDQPLVSLRISPKTPDTIWDEAMQVVATGIGFPALFNDDAIIPTRMSMGANPQDAWNYGVIGCVEQSVPGKEYAHTEGMRHN